ncbi:lytic transglycosylase domain-containing protein [Herbiconiux sp. UC225_62]|uniref:lytic transglycosylase domain-containing protein n=1 Tax=Herbiconiux sp. UC225_62 TaxID=3350168 RepID=UPI0036D2C880
MRKTWGAVVSGVVAAVLLTGCASGGAGSAGPGATFAVSADAPRASDVGDRAFTDGTPSAELVDSGWLDQVAAATGIPRRALQGYAGAALAISEQQPDCHLGWNTLAGIGWVESHHGTIFGGDIQDDGVTSDLIIGVALDGNGFQEIPDSDAGAVDGDTEWDRAVGPMQIVPTTWAAWATEANGDGVPDIHNIDDASLSAAEYLCYSGGDLGTEDGWRTAIAAYNESPAYLDEVLDYANRYADEAADAG